MYGTFTCAPAGKVQLNVSAAGATTKVVSAYVCVTDALSVTFTVNDVVVAVVGVPLIAPVVALIDIHAGAPTSEYVYAGVPPPALQLAPVYATFTCAVAGNVQLSVKGGGATTKAGTAKVVLTAGVSLSVTLTEKLYVPEAVGVPLIAPVVALIDIHAGAPTSEYV